MHRKFKSFESAKIISIDYSISKHEANKTIIIIHKYQADYEWIKKVCSNMHTCRLI